MMFSKKLPALCLFTLVGLAGCGENKPADTTATQTPPASNTTTPQQADTNNTTNNADGKVRIQTEPPTDPEVVTVVMSGASNPFSATSETGELSGMDVEIMSAVAEAAGLKVAFYVQPWGTLMDSVAKGDYHVTLDGMNYSAERDEKYGLTDTYLDNPPAIAYKTDGKYSPKTPEALAGLSVSVKQGTTHDTLVSGIPEIKQVERYDHIHHSFRAVASGQADATVGDLVPLQLMAKQYPEVAITINPYPVADEKTTKLIMVTKKDNQALKEKLNQGIAAVKANGKIDEIRKKYLGE